MTTEKPNTESSTTEPIDKGTQIVGTLPPLPYYPLKSAALRLGCAEEDFLYWAEAGIAQLCVCLDGVDGVEFLTAPPLAEQRSSEAAIKNWLQSIPDTGALFPFTKYPMSGLSVSASPKITLRTCDDGSPEYAAMCIAYGLWAVVGMRCAAVPAGMSGGVDTRFTPWFYLPADSCADTAPCVLYHPAGAVDVPAISMQNLCITHKQLETLLRVPAPEGSTPDASMTDRVRKEWWSTADPDDPSTHPKNMDVEAWVVQQGIPKRRASVITSDARPTWAHRGRPAKPEQE